MEEWPDFLIYAVQYSDEPNKTRIEHVRALDTTELLKEMVGEPANPERVFTRDQVVKLILRNKIFKTFYETLTGEWEIGQIVHIIDINDDIFIRTDFNRTSIDNLERLPEFEFVE